MPQRPQIIREAARPKLKEPTAALWFFCFVFRVIILTKISVAEKLITAAKKTCNFTSNFTAFYQTLLLYFFYDC